MMSKDELMLLSSVFMAQWFAFPAMLAFANRYRNGSRCALGSIRTNLPIYARKNNFQTTTTVSVPEWDVIVTFVSRVRGDANAMAHSTGPISFVCANASPSSDVHNAQIALSYAQLVLSACGCSRYGQCCSVANVVHAVMQFGVVYDDEVAWLR